MKNKAFTLIELLAVIVILAIIALIATPIILNIINNARDESNKRSAELYLTAAELAVVKANFDNELFNTTCTVQQGGNMTCSGVDGTLQVKMDNSEEIKGGTIKFQDGKIICVSNLRIGNKAYSLQDGGNLVEATSTEESEDKPCTRVENEIVCGTEHFYVMSEDSTIVTALAKYNLDVGETAELIRGKWTLTPLTNTTGIQSSSSTASTYEPHRILTTVDADAIRELILYSAGEEELPEFCDQDDIDAEYWMVCHMNFEAISEISADVRLYRDEYIDYVTSNNINDRVIMYTTNYQNYLRNNLNVNNAVVRPPIIQTTVDIECDDETGDCRTIIGEFAPDEEPLFEFVTDFNGPDDGMYVRPIAEIPKSQIASGSINACE